MHIDPGFDPDHVLLNQFYLNTNGYTLAAARRISAAALQSACRLRLA